MWGKWTGYTTLVARLIGGPSTPGAGAATVSHLQQKQWQPGGEKDDTGIATEARRDNGSYCAPTCSPTSLTSFSLIVVCLLMIMIMIETVARRSWKACKKKQEKTAKIDVLIICRGWGGVSGPNDAHFFLSTMK